MPPTHPPTLLRSTTFNFLILILTYPTNYKSSATGVRHLWGWNSRVSIPIVSLGLRAALPTKGNFIAGPVVLYRNVSDAVPIPDMRQLLDEVVLGLRRPW